MGNLTLVFTKLDILGINKKAAASAGEELDFTSTSFS